MISVPQPEGSATPRQPEGASTFEPSRQEIFVLGAGGHAKVVLSALIEARIKVAGIYDDDPAKRGTEILRVPVLGVIHELHDTRQARWIIGLGDNATRHLLAGRLSAADWLTVVHPTAYVHESASLGRGTVVVAGAIIQPGARIGRHCIINTGATVDHDCVIGDFCHVAPGCNVGGAATLAEGVFIGIGSVVIQNVNVGAWTTVGAGAAVVTDLPDHVLALGVPARVKRKLQTRQPIATQ